MTARPQDATAKRAQPRPLPVHIVVAAGLTTATYAISLGVVSRWQVAEDRALIEDRAPVSQAIEMLARHHERLENGLGRAGRRFESAASRYQTVARRMNGLHEDLEALARLVGQIEGSSAQIPSSLALPPVPNVAPRVVTVAPPPAAPPPTNGNTGASGG